VKDDFHCIRVTPQNFTTVEEIDRICDVMEKIARA
jgi:selenocysteine lyase/cysteine desulfurase